MEVETSSPADVMKPIGPYSHIAKAGPMISISATAGVDPITNQLVGPDVHSQARRILESFERMLVGVGSSLEQVLHVNVYLKDMADFEALNQAYAEVFCTHRPARTVVSVIDLPKPGAVVTMSLLAVGRA